MLTLKKLNELAKKKQTTEQNVRREYVQHLFLSYLYQQPGTEHILFKGGTALRLVYGSPRFSEDLDFSAGRGNLVKIEDAVQNALGEIEREGVKTKIIEAKKTSGGYLAIIEFLLNKESVELQIEISFREKGLAGEIIAVSGDFMPSYTLMMLRKEQLVEEKIKALLTRQKPRDYYDLYYLLSRNLISGKQKDVLPQVLKMLDQTEISFKRELERFLPKSHHPLIKNFKAVLEREIRKYL